MNLYMVVFIACLHWSCGNNASPDPDVKFFTDIKQAIEFKVEKEEEDIGIVEAPRIFKVVPRRKKECKLSGGRSLAHYRCLKESEYTFDIFEVDAFLLKPVAKYEIIETTVQYKHPHDNTVLTPKND